MAKDSAEQAKRYIDASLKARARRGQTRPPSRASYARAIRLARRAIEDLMQLARRAERNT